MTLFLPPSPINVHKYLTYLSQVHKLSFESNIIILLSLASVVQFFNLHLLLFVGSLIYLVIW
jgi:hypothetical protein